MLFFFPLITDLYFFIPAISIVIPTKEAKKKKKNETHPVIAEIEISVCSM